MIILASQSPRRQQLMHSITDDFIVEVSHIDESSSLNMTPVNAVRDIAKRKGLDIHNKYPHDLVLSADTIVVIDNQIIGKPIDEEDAKRILKLLSGRTHHVLTAFYLIKDNKEYEEVVDSEVTFEELSDSLIDDYIKSGSPMDKAGAYGAQDNNDFKLIKKITGSWSNVIGFPVKKKKKAINNL